MLKDLFLLILGFIFLVKGADYFVSGASAAGSRLKIPQIVIGLTIVALGTSLPELFINIIGSLAHKNDIVLGNIIGSNIFNILMILGTTAIIYPITAARNTIKKEIPFVILVSVILLMLSYDNLWGGSESTISRFDGILLLLFCAYFIYYLVKLSRNSETAPSSGEKLNTYIILIYILIGIFGLVEGGNLVVDSAVEIARYAGLSDKVIALTIISAGTGLPELVTSIVAATKKNSEIALGNIIGSNIFNILLVIGVSSLIYPIEVPEKSYTFDYLILVLSSLILFTTMFVLKKSIITRMEGFLMVLMYALYITFNVIRF